MKSIFIQFFCLLTFFSLSAEIKPTFSIGTIGGGANSTSSTVTGTFDGSIIDIYFVDQNSKTGLQISPFNFSLSTVSSKSNFSFINFTLYHQTFKILNNSFIGPFIKCNWINFIDNQPTYSTGLKLSIRDDFRINFLGSDVTYTEPILFNYVNLELGAKYDNRNIGVYFCITTDLSVMVPIVSLLLYSASAKNPIN